MTSNNKNIIFSNLILKIKNNVLEMKLLNIIDKTWIIKPQNFNVTYNLSILFVIRILILLL